MQVFSACWRENEKLLRSQGVEEAAVAQTWSALASYVRDNLTQGRGVNLPGVCKLLKPRTKAGLSVVLSDTLLKRFPNMQLGSGMSHFAAVRDHVQGAEDVNHIKLAQRCKGLDRDAVQLILKAMTGSITHLIEQQQSFSLDLGVGQLRFKSGKVAEFQLNSSSSSMFSPAGTAEAGRAGGGEPNSSGLTAGALSQLGGGGSGPSGSRSTVSRVSKVSHTSSIHNTAAAADPPNTNLGLIGSSISPQPLTVNTTQSPYSSVNGSISSGRSPSQRRPGDIPEKPSSSPLSPNDILAARKQARSAAVANARVKPATFILPAGAPDELEEQRMPQGKGRATAAGSLGHQAVLDAAAAREQRTKASRAAEEAELMAKNAALKETLDAQAATLRRQQEASKKQLVDTLAQQIREKQTPKPGSDSGGVLLVGKTAEEISTQRLKQQAEYRAALNEQLAAKASHQQHQKAEDTQQALAELQKVQQSVVAAAQASRSHRQQAVDVLRHQLKSQALTNKGKQEL